MGKRTFDALNLLGGKAGEGPLMLGPRYASGTDIPLDVNNGSSHGGLPLARGSLPTGQPFGRHRSADSARELGRGSGYAGTSSDGVSSSNWVRRDTGNECCNKEAPRAAGNATAVGGVRKGHKNVAGARTLGAQVSDVLVDSTGKESGNSRGPVSLKATDGYTYARATGTKVGFVGEMGSY